MRISGISGLISVIFLAVVFPITLIPVYHYWREKNAKGVSQRKKRRFLKLMQIWICIAAFAIVVGLIGAAGYYFSPQPSERQYVSIKSNNVELSAGEPVIFRMEIVNGRGEVTVVFHDVTQKFRGRSSDKVLTYQPEHTEGPESKIKLTPYQPKMLQWTFYNLILTKEQIDDLNSKIADGQLFFFGNWEWIDESGNRNQQPTFCYQYSRRFPGNLAECRDDIKFKQAMPKKTELREGKEAAERFQNLTAQIMSVPKSEIDKRAANEREKRQSEDTEAAE